MAVLKLSFHPLPPQAHSLSASQSRSQFSCSACDRSFSLLSSLLTHQHSHTPEQRLLAEAEAEIVCPPSLSLTLPLPASPAAAKPREGEEIHVSLIAVTEDGDREPAKGKRGAPKGPKRAGANRAAVGNNGAAATLRVLFRCGARLGCEQISQILQR